MTLKIGIVGATGNVGREMLSILAEKPAPFWDTRLSEVSDFSCYCPYCLKLAIGL